ncbi:MAG TPA: hypothetical protein VHX44_14375 [Planctomycetota bacterium]|jgi:hypothetical protein|nr:hypothetical protein [Planctomycetota bacterium]
MTIPLTYQWLALLAVFYSAALGWRKGVPLAAAVVLGFIAVKVAS